MVFVSFLILAGPAALSWMLCNLLGCRQRERLRDVLLTLIADSFLILIGAYILNSYLFHVNTSSFWTLFDPAAEKSIYHISFAWKFMALSALLSVMLAGAKCLFQKITRKRGNANEKNP